MEHLVEIIAKHLVSNPDAVSVKSVVEDGNTVIYLKTAPEDAGRVIGKGGKTAKAIRTVAEAACAAEGKSVRVRIDG